MSSYLIKRLLNMIPVLLLVTIFSFGIMQMAPGGPESYLLNTEDATIDISKVEQLRAQWGLDQPLPVQYAKWLKNAATGDFGYSYFQRRPVSEIIMEAIPNTFQLNIVILILIYAIAIPLGVISAVKQYSKFDYMVTGLAFLGQSAPIFWTGPLAIWAIAMQSNGLIPTNGIATPGVDFETYGWISVIGDRARYMILPVLVSTFSGLTGLTRYMRSSMLEVLKEDFTRTARAKGLHERVVIYKHALRNALLPIVTLSGGILAGLVGGSVILENIFSWPGIGRVSFDALNTRDYPVSMALLLVSAMLALIGNFAVDIAYVFVDPRIKYD